ncbi:MAG TPA: secondary thiamine-phosphate synthase enzyme YjbQ [Spirochaetota bacterium]|nr:secondary thiamine-phosphate synthase enzyme YjbQ [Spirochaetota bacterium]
MIHHLSIKSTHREEFISITNEIRKIVELEGVKEGICYIYTPHTTAGITINENADPDVASDILKGLRHLDLESVRFNHCEGNSPAHIKSSLIGCSSFVFIENGRLKLGTWQGIFFCEFDGPRSREVYAKIIS